MTQEEFLFSGTFSTDDIFCTFKISEEHFQRIEEIEKSPEFMQNLYLTIINFKTEQRTYEEKDHLLFCNKYFYSINTLLHSLNGYFLDVFIKLNKDENIPTKEWEYIYEKQNQRNNIVNLFVYYLCVKNIKTNAAYQLLTKLFIYENLFRHQLSHGWFNIFLKLDYSFIRDKTMMTVLNELPIDNKKSPKKIENKTLDLLRKLSKQKDLDQVKYNMFLSNLKKIETKEEKDSYVFFEPMVVLSIKREEINLSINEELKKQNQGILLDNLDTIQENRFSLNHLLRTIVDIVELIEKPSNLKNL